MRGVARVIGGGGFHRLPPGRIASSRSARFPVRSEPGPQGDAQVGQDLGAADIACRHDRYGLPSGLDGIVDVSHIAVTVEPNLKGAA